MSTATRFFNTLIEKACAGAYGAVLLQYLRFAEAPGLERGQLYAVDVQPALDALSLPTVTLKFKSAFFGVAADKVRESVADQVLLACSRIHDAVPKAEPPPLSVPKEADKDVDTLIAEANERAQQKLAEQHEQDLAQIAQEYEAEKEGDVPAEIREEFATLQARINTLEGFEREHGILTERVRELQDQIAALSETQAATAERRDSLMIDLEEAESRVSQLTIAFDELFFNFGRDMARDVMLEVLTQKQSGRIYPDHYDPGDLKSRIYSVFQKFAGS